MRKWFTSRMRAIAFLLLVVFPATPLLLLTGCGGGGNIVRPAQTSTYIITPTPVAGTLNADQIGGTALTIYSSLGQPATVQSTGAFATQVSDVGTQMLLAKDAGGKLRGLGMNIPAGRRGRATPLVIDAENTALGLLFLTPGICACDPGEAAQRVTDVKALAGFRPFADYLTTALKTTDVGTLVQSDTQFAALEKACIDAWFQQHPLVAGLGASREDIKSYTILSPSPGYEANIFFKDTTTNQDAYNNARTFEITNNAWRFVEIYRKDTRRESHLTSWTTASTGLFSLLKGVNGVSMGSLLTGQATSGGTINDVPPRNTDEKSEYYIVGPGWKTPEVDWPADIPSRGYNALGATVTWSLMLPILSLIGGLGDLYKQVNPTVLALASTKLWEDISKNQTIHDITGSILNDLSSGDEKSITSGIINLAVTALALFAGSGTMAAFLTTVGVPSAAAIAAGTVTTLALVSAAMSLNNIINAIQGWASYPTITRFTVEDYHIGLVLTATPESGGSLPANGIDKLTLTATVKHFTDTQDYTSSDPPAGPVVSNAKLHFATSLGTITEKNSTTYDTVTDANGQAVIHVTSIKGGEAKVDVKASETHNGLDSAAIMKSVTMNYNPFVGTWVGTITDNRLPGKTFDWTWVITASPPNILHFVYTSTNFPMGTYGSYNGTYDSKNNIDLLGGDTYTTTLNGNKLSFTDYNPSTGNWQSLTVTRQPSQ